MKLIADAFSVLVACVAFAVASWWPELAFGLFFGLWINYHLHDDIIGFPRPGRKL